MGGSCRWPAVGAFLLHMCLIFSVCLLLHRHKAAFVCPPRRTQQRRGCGISSDCNHSAYMGPCNLGHMRRLLEVNLGCGQECCHPALSAHYAGTAGSPSHPEVVQHSCKKKKKKSLLSFGILSTCLPVKPQNNAKQKLYILFQNPSAKKPSKTCRFFFQTQ